jgi:o-succinylbenzoate---CoA ligase
MHSRPPRLVAVRLSSAGGGPHPWDRVQRVWADGDAVLPLPDDAAEAARLVAAFTPDVVAAGEAMAVPAGSPPDGGRPPLTPGAALVVATSGSTGGRRGVVLSRGAVHAAVAASLARTGADHSDRWLCCLPLVHAAGLLVLARAEAAGARAVVHDRFDVAAVAAALEGPAPPTQVSLVPTMLHRLLEAGVELRRLRCILLGGARPTPELLDRARAAGAPVVTTYGMTETCGGVVYDGVPLDGVAVGLEPDGRILLSGPTLATGYADGGGLALDGEWLRTDDHGRWQADGRLDVRGRLDDVVVTGGENVDTAEVTRLLSALPNVAAAAVAGVPDPEWGERVEAWIVPATTPPRLAEVAAYLAERVPPHAVPKRIHLVGHLPRTALGKLARPALPDLRPTATWPDPPVRDDGIGESRTGATLDRDMMGGDGTSAAGAGDD